MKYKLTKASNYEDERKGTLSTMADLISLLREYPCGNAVIYTREIKDFVPTATGLKPVYKDLNEIEIVIYDDYIE